MPPDKPLHAAKSDETLHTDSHNAPPGYLEVFALLHHSGRSMATTCSCHTSRTQDHRTLTMPTIAYDQRRLPKLGAWLLHGHSHSITHRGITASTSASTPAT
jgi:hypothetical protein